MNVQQRRNKRKIFNIIGETLYKIVVGFLLPIGLFILWRGVFTMDVENPDPSFGIGAGLFGIMAGALTISLLYNIFSVISETFEDTYYLITKGKIKDDRIFQRIKSEDLEQKNKQLNELNLPLTLAPKELYEKWLDEYKKYNNHTYRFPYNFERREWFMPKTNYCNIVINGYYGADSFYLIIPKSFKGKLKINNLGHCNIFDLRDYSHYGYEVPIYRNLILKDK